MARLLLMLAAAATAVALGAGVARSDGDPASDVLYNDNVFVPYPAPAATAAAGLRSAVATAYKHGYRLKVAVIKTPTDLGSVPSLFGKPASYAHFLGTELKQLYIGPLLIAMPDGWGIWDGGRSTTAEHRVLSSISIDGSTATTLTESAAAAVRTLVAKGALKSKDIKAPLVYPIPRRVQRGATVRLQYAVMDDSGKSREVVTVFARTTRLARLVDPMERTSATSYDSVTWRVPTTLTTSQLRFCVVATDPSGNSSKPACGAFDVV